MTDTIERPAPRVSSMNCPICQSVPDREFRWQAPYVTVIRCSGCGHLFAEDPAPGQGMPPVPDIAAEYQVHAEQNRRLVRRWRRDGFLYPGARVLDVGAGIGHVAQAIRDSLSDARIYCLEPEPGAAAFLKGQGFTVIGSLAQVERVDAITLIEVIEHVDDPIELLTQCRRVLAPDGRLFLTTPCGETTTGRRPMGGYIIPEHIQFFTERSLQLACRKAGFNDVKFIGPDVMHPRSSGIRYAVSLAKSAIRPFRDMVTGRQRLIGYVQ